MARHVPAAATRQTADDVVTGLCTEKFRLLRWPEMDLDGGTVEVNHTAEGEGQGERSPSRRSARVSAESDQDDSRPWVGILRDHGPGARRRSSRDVSSRAITVTAAAGLAYGIARQA